MTKQSPFQKMSKHINPSVVSEIVSDDVKVDPTHTPISL